MSSGEFPQQCDSGLPTYRMLTCRNEQSGDHFYPLYESWNFNNKSNCTKCKIGMYCKSFYVISILYHFQPKRFVWLVGFLPPNFKFTKLKESTEEGNPVIYFIYIYIYIYIYNKYNIIICSNLQLTQRLPNPLWLNTLPSLCQICPFYLHKSFSNNQVCVIRLSLEFHTLTDWLKNWIKDSQTDTMMSRLKFVPFTRILYGFNKTSHETFRKQNNRQTDILHSKHPLEKQKSM